MAISTRKRFEIFKRDAFTCHYCGQKPPQVILHVDHIQPSSKGGSDDPLNLITSCADCNLGKSSVPLTTALPDMQKQREMEMEKHEQVKKFNQWLKARRKEKENEFRQVSNLIISYMGDDPDKYCLAGEPARIVRSFLQKMPYEMLLEAVEITHGRVGFNTASNRPFKYLCGVCWKMIRPEGGSDASEVS